MVTVIRAMCVAPAILCLPMVVIAATGASPRAESDQAASAGVSLVTDGNPGAAIDAKPFAVSVAPPKAAGPPAPRGQGGASSPRRDRLWNGALIGAGVGALVGVLTAQALLPCSACAGFNVPLTFGVLGAGAGAGVGAGIDARRHSRSPGLTTPGRITVAPILTKEQRGVVALVRF